MYFDCEKYGLRTGLWSYGVRDLDLDLDLSPLDSHERRSKRVISKSLTYFIQVQKCLELVGYGWACYFITLLRSMYFTAEDRPRLVGFLVSLDVV